MKTILFLILAATAAAQVKRPAVPSAATLASPSSQIAAWYNYAVYCEQQIAVLKAQPAPTATPAPAPVIDPTPFINALAGLDAKLTAIASTLHVERVLVAPTQDRVTLTWIHDGVGITGFVIERSTDGKTFTEQARVTAADRVWRQTGIPGGVYWYRVRSIGTNGVVSDPTNIVSLVFG